jgi:hypothetical protein
MAVSCVLKILKKLKVNFSYQCKKLYTSPLRSSRNRYQKQIFTSNV